MKKQNAFCVGIVSACVVLMSPLAEAKLNVITTLTDFNSITTEIGGEFISVQSIAKGTQDPHYIEAKPSFMVNASKADLIIANGLDLEVGWLPSILRGARNPKINPGKLGYLEVGTEVEPLEVHTGTLTRKDGDVHPMGNPHVSLDPIRAGTIAMVIARRLGELDPEHASLFLQNATNLKTRLEKKTEEWRARIEKTGIKKVITYHKTLTYFLNRFELENPAILEPKPGIPPTSGHIIQVIELIKKQHIPLIMVENYFDPTVTNKIQHEVPSIRAVTVAVSVGGEKNIKTMDDLYENLVKRIEGK